MSACTWSKTRSRKACARCLVAFSLSLSLSLHHVSLFEIRPRAPLSCRGRQNLSGFACSWDGSASTCQDLHCCSGEDRSSSMQVLETSPGETLCCSRANIALVFLDAMGLSILSSPQHVIDREQI